MPIQILPARLANQIAAGEVVERPASVVKELVENSLDAGATRIEIEIEKGGAKCIRIKDNGKGVCKEQLTLALSRHATSKISHLDDLEAIVSLGFRGEALASVSSVSRLTFTSKPTDQEQAWQAVAEGRDMKVDIQPAAHPQGTTVEVLDLFFNTPARRRFLKTEKTEFQHIDELIRRIALSRFEISFILKHNGKIIRQYRAAQTQIQQEKRLASICSESFVKGALHFQGSDNELKISGWISDSLSARVLSDVQYCYINGRMIRDKLINHAIKQVYAYTLPPGKFPGYVIYIECNPDQVDVNVHPSKHEVRFHEARWVHDFIVSTLSSTLNEGPLLNPDEAGSVQTKPAEHFYQPPQQSETGTLQETYTAPPTSASAPSYSPSYSPGYTKTPLDEAQVNAYCDFVAEAHLSSPSALPLAPEQQVRAPHTSVSAGAQFAQTLCLVKNEYLLLKINPSQQILQTTSPLLVLSLKQAEAVVKQFQLFDAWTNGEVISQPLLLPVRVQLDAALLQICEDFQELFKRLGFAFKVQGSKLIISKVPALLRQAPVAKILPDLLTYLTSLDKTLNESQVNDFCAFLVKTQQKYQLESCQWTEKTALSQLDLLLSLFSGNMSLYQDILFHEPDLSLLVQGFSDE
ncbi:DNA mismatch repair endonuclease MutL [Psychromonas ossibalaenae]|uniref:DNA mismatch repair endonuclease MutL n=1 Tax=Psychromonas ossibalaenae TaxID=444922 RepID=UPI00037993CB|nr:DNA mismatch repair endonuclease MutL [Psychromonas ossibalaenae]